MYGLAGGEMGIFECETDGRAIPLPGRAVVGRSAMAVVRIREKRVSSEHAVVWWEDERWWVRDLGSRNGTSVDGRDLPPGERVPLEAGVVVRFGGTDGWQLTQSDGPSALARRDDGAFVPGDGGILALPDADDPQVTVFRDAEGGWVAEDANGTTDVASGTVLAIDNVAYTLLLPTVDATWQADHSAMHVAELQMDFRVSPDEEHVEIELVHAGGRIALTPRAHHYLLVTLARQRLSDVALSPGERGWTTAEELERGLMLSTAGLKVQVFRSRQEFEKLGVVDAASLVERRFGTGQLRLGVPRVHVTTG